MNAADKGREAARALIAKAKSAGATLRMQAVAWYRAEDWPAWRALDPTFAPTFDQWKAWADGAFDEFHLAGVPVVKVIIIPGEFLSWANREMAGRVGQPERSLFAVLKAQQLREAPENAMRAGREER